MSCWKETAVRNRLLPLLLLFLSALPVHAAGLPALLQLVDYVGVDYTHAVQQGQVVSAAEYAEMQEFAGHIAAGLGALDLGGDAPALHALARQLQQRISGKADPAIISDLTRRLRQGLMQNADNSLPEAAGYKSLHISVSKF